MVDSGHFVVCLDNLSTGRSDNIDHLIDSDRFVFINHDVTKRFGAGLPRFDEIYNLACPASPVHYQADRVNTALVCALGAMHVLDRAGRDGAKLFHASTSEVYGDPEVHPQPESYVGNVNPIGPRACYDEGKRFAETLLTDYQRQYGLVVKIARIFNTYGPRMRQDDGRVVSNFIVQALKGEDITVYGDGEQTRSFCYVSDLVDGIVKLMNSSSALEGPVNIGNPAEFTMMELAELVIELTASSSKIIKLPRPVDDPQRRRPDIRKAKEQLGWSPKVDFAARSATNDRLFRWRTRGGSPGGTVRQRTQRAPLRARVHAGAVADARNAGGSLGSGARVIAFRQALSTFTHPSE